MKKYFTLTLLLSVIGANAFAQANKSLSNLTSPTSVNQSLIPSSAASKDLGSSSAGWQDLHLSGAIYLNGGKFINNPISGGNNTAVGWQVLHSVTSIGIQNTGVGYQALYSNTDGFDNTAGGVDALYSNTHGYGNTAIGGTALNSNTSGGANTAIGGPPPLFAGGALYSNTDGSFNTATGVNTLHDNTTGSYNTEDGDENGPDVSTGHDNVANGSIELGGIYNTANGSGALDLSTGNDNTADGSGAAAAPGYTTRSNNTFLGYNANSGSLGTSSNMTAIGNGATVTASNHIVIGNSSVTSIGGYDNWSKLSDGRVKKNIKQNVPGLAFINKLQPITYNLDLDAADKIIDRPAMRDKDGKVIQPAEEEIQARQAKEQIVYTGFVAQDVEKAAESLNYDFSGVDKPDNANTLYALRYGDFVVPLVEAVQELSQQNDDEDTKFADLQKQIDELKSATSSPSGISNQVSGMNGSEARLYQNTPNPFSQNTTIQFYIPASASDAMIEVCDLSGKTIQQFSHLTSGIGTVTISGGSLVSGTYQYSLVIGGKIIDTKQLIVLK